MNYFGKFDAKDSPDALGLHSGGHVHTETVHATHAPSGAIIVPDAHLLFGGEFKRSGVDLVLSDDDQKLVLHDYFKGEKRAALASPDGAHLTGDLVTALAGQVQYAQADGAAGAHQIIGHVTKLAGTATAVRNGVSIILNNGDNVEKGDVVASGSDSTLGITFIDGTVFGLSSNARMVLNEMVYDPNGSNNSSLLSLVAGTITFVAGETAKHGDMKVDTPVATMGIRGTAVLFAVHFKLPSGALVPDDQDPPADARPEGAFQVLTEPDGTVGSYILFDKTTLTPLAMVNQAGQQINISNGILSQTLAPLSPEIQKLITDVFTLKNSDSSDTKSLHNFTDSINPLLVQPLKLNFAQTPTPTIPVIVNLVVTNGDSNDNSGTGKGHQPIPPTFVNITNGSITELLGPKGTPLTGSTTPDKAAIKIDYNDVNSGDQPTVSVKFDSFTYADAQGHPLKLNQLQQNDITAVEAITNAVQQGILVNNKGTANWTYQVPDHAFDFLAAGETLTLTYNVTVDNNYAPNDLTGSKTFTITITGTNDAPVITSPQQNVSFFSAGTDTKGGELIPNTATIGKLTFTDPDLTDTHTVAVKMTSALLDGQSFATTVGPVVINELAAALTAKITAADDSTGTGTGTVEWALANLQVYLADLVPANESLVLTYAVTVTDSQNATSTQDIVVTISGNEGAAVVWTDTNPTTPALWNVASNWEGDRVPNTGGFNDDVFIGTDQVLPGTPTFPVTVNANAAAKSLTMDYFTDFGTSIPELDVESGVTLTIAGALSLDTSTDSGSPLTAESIIKNFGHISVGGIATLLKHSVLDNYGTITLAQGGVFGDQSSITNSGTIELTGGTLNVEVDIANFVTTTPGTIKIDGGTTLALSNGATISKGGITDSGTITGYGAISSVIAGLGVLTASGGTLTLSGLNTYSGATTIDSGAVLAAGVADTFSASSAVTDNGELDLGTTDQTIASLNGTNTAALVGSFSGTGTSPAVLTINNGGSFAGVVEDGSAGAATALTLAGGTLTLTGDNLYTGATTINGTLVLSGLGSIAGSSDIIDDGTLDISATTSGASIVTLSGDGTVDLGTETLTLTDASTTFSGAIDGSGGLTLTAGTETLTGDNLYTGATTINGGTLKLSGAGSIAGSSDVIDDGTFDISATTSGASIVTLSGTSAGTVTLGSETLTLSNASTTFNGAIDGSGGLTLTAGTEILSGDNLYTGVTTINGGTLALTGTGSIAKSSDVIDDGTFDISGTTSGASIVTLSGTTAGNVNARRADADADGSVDHLQRGDRRHRRPDGRRDNGRRHRHRDTDR